MSNVRKRILVCAGTVAIGAALLAGGTASAQAAPASTNTGAKPIATTQSVPCGYDGYKGSNGNQPLYNHCGTGSVVIEVDHFFWQTTYACMPRGVWEIPQGSSRWSIIGAEYDGHTCTYPYPIAIVGP